MRILLCIVLLASATFAYTPVQVGPNNCSFNPGGPGVAATGSLTCTFTSNVGANNALVIGVNARVLGATGVTSITDTLGTSYGLLKESHDAASGTWLYAGKPSSGGSNTVTVVLNGTYYY